MKYNYPIIVVMSEDKKFTYREPTYEEKKKFDDDMEKRRRRDVQLELAECHRQNAVRRENYMLAAYSENRERDRRKYAKEISERNAADLKARNLQREAFRLANEVREEESEWAKEQARRVIRCHVRNGSLKASRAHRILARIA